MRVTNKIIQNNSVSNININKTYQDKLNNQMSTEKKIVRPSDDPVVAIRALRLRTNVSQVTQYYEKNVPDAESWMDVTETALSTVSSVLTDMIEQCTKGSSEKLTTTDRQTILDALTALRDEVYSTGNADYAGRSVFTGYRTETTLMYTEAANQKYSITEQTNNDAMDTVKYVKGIDKLNSLNEGNYNSAANKDAKEQEIQEASVHRIRLAYENLDGDVAPTISLYDTTAPAGFKTAYTATVYSENANPTAYDKVIEDNAASPKVESVYLIKETGELLISDAVYDKLMALSDDVTTPTLDESQIQITYEKSVWKKGDLRPEHYFACKDLSAVDSSWTDPDKIEKATIKYNQDYLKGIVEKQSIEYDVGINQSIRVNTTADEVFTHAIGRDVDDIIAALSEVNDMEATIERLTKIKEGLDETATDYKDNLESITNQIDAANKALTYLKEKMQGLFESNITNMQNHLNKANEATTACGTRQKKLELINNRLMSQKTNFETLESENENVDLTEIAIKLSSAELTYQAALMSTSKILQTSLMNYI